MACEEEPQSLRQYSEERPLAEYTHSAQSTDFSRRLVRLVTAPSDELHYQGAVASTVLRTLDSSKTEALMMMLSLYALFADDMRLAVTSRQTDNYFFACACVCFVLFATEVGLSMWVRRNYLWGIYFWLDLIATLSMVPDIGWMWNEMVGSSDTGTGSKSAQVQNVGRSSRIGARTSRILRIVRLVRLIRMARLYKSARIAMERSDFSTIVPDEEYLIPQESRVGKKLDELTTKRIIVLVLAVLILLPLFELHFFIDNFTSWEFAMNQLDEMSGNNLFQQNMEVFLDYHRHDVRPLIFYSVNGPDTTTIWKGSSDPALLRLEEKYYVSSGSQVAIFDVRYDTQLDAWLSVVRTAFTCAVLALATFYITKDANEIVISPIEKMIERVKKIVKNPVGILDGGKFDMYESTEDDEETHCFERLCCKRQAAWTDLETGALDLALQKIATLLAVCFGEAGARIIAENMASGDSINPLLEGKKVLAIFGFCDIRNFTDTTEVLQESVMMFVNEIAEVVHHTVDHHLGVANKNVGDAFLMVWKFSDHLCRYSGNSLLLCNSPEVSIFADLSVVAFIKVQSKISMQLDILRYRNHPDLRKRIPNYAVRMGFGLHMGWAIEGAIGSALKVDASYLSPHVNITMKMEELTKYYNKSILFTSTVFDLCSHSLQVKCRHLDTLQSDTGVVVRLYTIDLDLTSLLPVRKRMASPANRGRKRQRISQLMRKQPGGVSTDLFEKSKYLQHLTQGVSPQFIEIYNGAAEKMEKGLWQDCREDLEKCLDLQPGDLPAHILLKYISQYNFTPPSDWSGSRPFPSK